MKHLCRISVAFLIAIILNCVAHANQPAVSWETSQIDPNLFNGLTVVRYDELGRRHVFGQSDSALQQLRYQLSDKDGHQLINAVIVDTTFNAPVDTLENFDIAIDLANDEVHLVWQQTRNQGDDKENLFLRSVRLSDTIIPNSDILALSVRETNQFRVRFSRLNVQLDSQSQSLHILYQKKYKPDSLGAGTSVVELRYAEVDLTAMVRVVSRRETLLTDSYEFGPLDAVLLPVTQVDGASKLHILYMKSVGNIPNVQYLPHYDRYSIPIDPSHSDFPNNNITVDTDTPYDRRLMSAVIDPIGDIHIILRENELGSFSMAYQKLHGATGQVIPLPRSEPYRFVATHQDRIELQVNKRGHIDHFQTRHTWQGNASCNPDTCETSVEIIHRKFNFSSNLRMPGIVVDQFSERTKNGRVNKDRELIITNLHFGMAQSGSPRMHYKKRLYDPISRSHSTEAHQLHQVPLAISGSLGSVTDPITLHLDNGIPSFRELFYYGRQLEPSSSMLDCGDLDLSPARRKGAGTANSMGQLSIGGAVPTDLQDNFRGRTVYVQVLERNTCRVSNVLEHTFDP